MQTGRWLFKSPFNARKMRQKVVAICRLGDTITTCVAAHKRITLRASAILDGLFETESVDIVADISHCRVLIARDSSTGITTTANGVPASSPTAGR
jgi:hypothetical protein